MTEQLVNILKKALGSLADLFKHMGTGKDNETYDVIRVMCMLIIIFALGATGYVVYKKDTFDIVNFGLGIASILGSVGAVLKLKETTEPDPK